MGREPTEGARLLLEGYFDIHEENAIYFFSSAFSIPVISEHQILLSCVQDITHEADAMGYGHSKGNVPKFHFRRNLINIRPLMFCTICMFLFKLCGAGN